MNHSGEINLLFVYGSLLLPSNQYGSFLQNNSTLVSEGWLRGYLYDCGGYPAAVPIEHTQEKVEGRIYLLHDDEIILKYLDDYEGFGEQFTDPNEFVRKKLDIHTDLETINCWVYLYNRPTDGLKKIPGGNYLKYKESPDHSGDSKTNKLIF